MMNTDVRKKINDILSSDPRSLLDKGFIIPEDRDLENKLREFLVKALANELQLKKELESHKKKSEKEIKDIQHQLLQAGKLAAVGELAAGLAHELNNPVGGILGYAQFMHEKMTALAEKGDETSIRLSKYMDFIARESKRCKTIIENLLKFSRSSRLEFSNTDINVVLSDTVNIVKHQIILENISFKTCFSKELPLVHGDAGQLQQVFLNILINALKAVSAVDRDRYIYISTGVELHKNQSIINVKIEDNGCGIEETLLPKIFDPFFTTRKPGEGTGLGLSLSYGIIKEHGGDIEVESILGEKTVFSVILPFRKEL